MVAESNIALAIVGLGKIARDQHLPSIEAVDGIELKAIASRNAGLDGLPSFHDIDELLGSDIAIDAVSLCTPPQGRFSQAYAALKARKHVMLEKPPGATISEVQALGRLAQAEDVTLYATWHSREAAAVEPAREFLKDAEIRSVSVTWKEDVRHWHPGQQWIWESGGLGVFDPGINALSIVTHILPERFFLTQSDLYFPENRAAPIAADLQFQTESGIPVSFELDWRQTGPQTWDIRVETDKGTVLLSRGGSRLTIAGTEKMAEPDREYQRLYKRFVQLIGAGRSDVDLAPLTHVADAFLLGKRHVVEAFED
ncbi:MULTISPECIES: Gfo/Idh/MocA family protein [Brucella/Ochrobactrum group]|uniref:Galactose 1-dehydrogenase n=1 Tax=Brucella anthropi (strain ATCC 49188 / DSM 6882 / CCUG 24695 / JCM 21032 / LMG 3331 / NBRC 15819 / NCTC 12168 / Alc 37) TaxID=439375 RepID=A6WYT3_BRUA4|nr:MULTISPECIES: Gfo/Idh/MocA family oxidoreductase [Brucella/Ochrobactrum group]ABS14137.1 Galactose 1-dehydrogenase [Brucella anthropi ATCC 49188]AIK44639.1 oxidoreductase, NAD-binding Rossmann fold family protein [Brucella anthropi]KAB2732917.1 Gfo/Idh/MocA family oxidoreductase [Brucella anthropi]KAB2753246.1 Gfo/Idh/MocA family oxidoreductase [Brucella anthropi]KAB2761147.1 Gfo/Idh/MocA family oxidoreductase [Brucella anthropi]